mgnify:CR=1 FL=1
MQRVAVGLDLSLLTLLRVVSGLYMRKVLLALFVLGLSLSTCLIAQTSQPIIPLDQIRTGMRGVAYTVNDLVGRSGFGEIVGRGVGFRLGHWTKSVE